MNFSNCTKQTNDQNTLKMGKIKKNTNYITYKYEALDVHTMLDFFIKFCIKLSTFTLSSHSQDECYMLIIIIPKLKRVNNKN